MIGVVIPTLNEERSLPALLEDLSALAREGELDVVVADAGSTDGTIPRATAAGARVIVSSPGRATQLNAGAAVARGEWLLFLHADCRVHAAARHALLQAVTPGSDLQAGVFRFAIDLPPFWKRLIELGQRVREVVLKLPYGDQGLLVRRRLFERVGRYPDIPLMEDVALVHRLRRHGPIHRLPARAVTSGRRYLRDGIVRTWLRHTALITLYFAGVSPARLARWRHA